MRNRWVIVLASLTLVAIVRLVDSPLIAQQAGGPPPLVISLPLTPLEGNVLLPYECHEGNLAVFQSLSAERAEDKALADDLATGIKRERRGVQASGAGGGGRGRGAGAGRAGGAGGRGAGRGDQAPPEGDQER
jgi:hypothetical protein